jgi:hypothetical protein
MFFIESSMFGAGWLVSSCELITSIGDAEVVTVRSVRRVPVMMIWSLLTPGAGAGAGCAARAESVAKTAIAVTAVEKSKGLKARMRELAIVTPRSLITPAAMCAAATTQDG